MIAALIYTTNVQNRLSTQLTMLDDQVIAAAKKVRSARSAVAKLNSEQRAYLGIIITSPFHLPNAQKGSSWPLPNELIWQRARPAVDRWLVPAMDLDTEYNLVTILI